MTWEWLKEAAALREHPNTDMAPYSPPCCPNLLSGLICHSTVWGGSGRDGRGDPEPRLPRQLPQQHGLLLENSTACGLW